MEPCVSFHEPCARDGRARYRYGSHNLSRTLVTRSGALCFGSLHELRAALYGACARPVHTSSADHRAALPALPR